MMTESLADASTDASESLYARLGGETVLRQFVNRLYSFMDEDASVAPVRRMHSENLSYASDRLFMFLSGMLGGPPLYMEAFGHPRLRQKHLHFSIGDEERDQWMLCAQHAADQLDIEDALRDELIGVLARMADHLRNKGPQARPCGQPKNMS